MRTQLMPAASGPCGSGLTICAVGTMHIQTALAQKVPASVRAVRIDYDPDTRCLCLVMLDESAKGTLTLLRKGLSRERGLRIEARGLLRKAGLLPAAKITLPAKWDAETREIVVVLPLPGQSQAPTTLKANEADIEHLRRENQPAKALIRRLHEQLRKTQDDLAEVQAGQRTPSDPCASPGRPSKRDAKRAEALNEIINFEDSRSVTDRGLCETCMYCPGGVCERQGSPNLHMRVGALCFCSLYGYDGHQVWAPASGDEPEEKQKGPRPNRVGEKRPRVTCAGCGKVFPADKKGIPWAHDSKGRIYRGLSLKWADKSNPCLGNGKEGTP